MRQLIVGTRGSALALAQTEIVCAALRRAHPTLDFRVERITTTGDRRADTPLSELGRGIFVTEIEASLRARHIDIAVHSAKDLPSTLPDDLAFAAILRRADARDVLVSRFGGMRELPGGARVGTSSPRRACLLRAMRPDLEPRDIRGNVDTRLRRLAAGEYDAVVLAAAGLIRLGRASEITEWLDVDRMVPSVGQGALAVEARADDGEIMALLEPLDDSATRQAVLAERAFLAELGAGCRAAAGAFALADAANGLRLTAFIGAADGRHVRAIRTGHASASVHLGVAVAHELLCAGGAAYLARTDSALAGKRIAVTRAESQSAELMALLRANGAKPVACPAIEIAPTTDLSPLDAALRDLGTMEWVVFTSANAVRVFDDRVRVLKLAVPRSLRLAAIGEATAAAVASRIRPADFAPSAATAERLVAELPVRTGSRVLFPRSDIARDTLREGLRRRGVVVVDVETYRTLPAAGIIALASLVGSGDLDAVVFTSPSSVRAAEGAMRAAISPRPAILCIGRTTALAAREAGCPPTAVATTQTVGGIVEALEQLFAAPALAGTPAAALTGY